MKSFTIEKLKSLKKGEWVYIIDKRDDYLPTQEYYTQIAVPYNDIAECIFMGDGYILYDFDDYGTKWIAYKNKEQAENNGDSENESNIFQIPRKVGYDMVFIDNSKGDEYLEIKDDFIIDRYEIRSYGLVVCGYNPHTGEKCEMLAKHYGETWFADRVQAEQKLRNV